MSRTTNDFNTAITVQGPKCQTPSPALQTLLELEPNMPALEKADVKGNAEDPEAVLEEDFSPAGSYASDVSGFMQFAC